MTLDPPAFTSLTTPGYSSLLKKPLMAPGSGGKMPLIPALRGQRQAYL